MSTPNPITFPPLKQGFSWVDATQNTDDSAIAAGEVTGYTIGVRADGVGAGNPTATPPVLPTYSTLVLITGAAVTAETLAAFNAALTSALPAGNYWAAVQEQSVNGPSAFSAEAPFSIVSSAPPKAPTGFMAS